jgi:tRNA threonylcarbamoyladenosine biosynthesis protein TsaB
MEISIDTATRYASVALSSQGEMIAEYSWRSAQNHSVELVPAVRLVMEHAGVEMDAIEAVFVVRGPGGFSALRVGISVAKALAVGRGIPLVGIGTLEVEASPYLGLGLPVCAALGASRSTVYAATFDVGLGEAAASNLRVESPEELAASVDQPTLFCGEAVAGLADILKESLGDAAIIAKSPCPTRRPAVVAQLGHSQMQATGGEDPALLQPQYMRSAQINSAKKRK